MTDPRDTSESRAIIFHELSRARQEMRSLRDFTEVALDSVPGVFYVFRETGELARWNRNFEHVTGYTVREIASMKSLDFFDEQERAVVADGMSQALLRGEFSIEAGLLTKAGKRIPYLLTASRVDLDGEPHLVGVGIDISDRKAAEERLAYQALLLSDVSDAVVSSELVDKNFLIRSWNKGAERIYGWTAEEAVSRPYGELMLPLYQGMSREEVLDKFEKAGRFEGEVSHRRKDGGRVDIWTSVSKAKGPSGEPIGVVAVNRDITALKRAREAVVDSEQKYRHLVEDMQDVVFAMDAAGAVTYISPRAEEFTGWTPEEITGRNFLEFIHQDDRAAATERVEKQMRGIRAEGEFRIVDKYDRVRWVRTSTRAIVQNSIVVGLRGVLIDVTDRKRTEEENLRIAKLESLAMLAGGVAHDFNNILTAVMTNLSIAAEQAAAGEDVTQSIDDSRRAAAMAKALTQQLLSFSKGGEPVKDVVSLGEVVRESAGCALNGATGKLDLSVGNDLWLCEADPSQIGRVIENLVVNADQAMDGGGTIEITVDNAECAALAEGASGETSPERCVRITIADHGVGIPETDLQRVFDPYFTTKEGGNGLGLATAHSIVSRHNGRISVSSGRAEGTVFTILLPATEKPARRSTVPPRSALAGQERVLVMDDDVLVRQSSERVLTRLGYDVEVVEDGEAALIEYERALRDGNPFDLVIMDLVIPGGMGGKEAIERLLEIDPNAKAIVCSGYSTDPVLGDHRQHGFKAAVAKPFDLHQLGATIRTVLEGE